MTMRQITFHLLLLLCIGFPDLVKSDLEQPARVAFPALCESCFNNDVAITGTWLEPEDSKVIDAFREYLKLIPRPYYQDCSRCAGCGGVTLDSNNDFDLASDNGFDRIRDCHQVAVGARVVDCRCGAIGPCEAQCWDGGYFRKWNHKYQAFFLHHLQYCSENNPCRCFWPEVSGFAQYDNDVVYRVLKKLTDQGLIDHTFSADWIARDIDWKWIENGSFGRFVKHYTTDYYPNNHGIASSLVTYTFFYSQYHQMLLDIAAFIDQNTELHNTSGLDEIYLLLERLRRTFSWRYDYCLRLHPHPKIYYERGMLRMHSGQTEAALEDIRTLMEIANSDQYKNSCLLTAEMYRQEGQAYAELGAYDKAIASLTEAIKRDPSNKDAYFQRAGAYFEKGQFDMALSDFLSPDVETLRPIGSLPTLEFEKALMVGLLRGTGEAVVDFIPSMCHSAYGLGRALWVCAKDPVRSHQSFVKSCWEITDAIKTYCRTVDWDTVEGYSQQMRDLYKSYHSLSDQEKGDLIGYTVARYGVDIFIGSATLKTVGAYKKLRDANRICNLEAMLAESTENRVLVEAVSHARAREQYFSNVSIHWGKQNKHIPGAHNFDPNRGRIKISKARLEELVRQNAGKGKRVNNRSELSPDYLERVDFNEIIGDYALQVKGEPTEFFPTTKGILRYGKDGVHVSPAHPNSL